ncbi:MAG: hypothetical protein ACTS41_01040 [Candidatus Hodgkinia cicadicola]
MEGVNRTSADVASGLPADVQSNVRELQQPPKGALLRRKFVHCKRARERGKLYRKTFPRRLRSEVWGSPFAGELMREGAPFGLKRNSSAEVEGTESCRDGG